MSQSWEPAAGHTVRLLGFWASSPSSDDLPDRVELPDPVELVDADWDEDERRRIADYLDRGQIAAEFMGASRCRLCARANGCRDLTDGTYLWPEGLAHYVLAHGVRLPAEFLAHLEQRLQQLADLERDSSWWRKNAKRI